MKVIIATLTFLILSLSNLMAQVQVTYNHDSPKQNQITVQETGAGALTPEFYYWMLHNKYKKSAAIKNKLGFRTTAGIGLYNQVDDAEKIDSAFTKRAKIEALNVTDRQVDIAWNTEGHKVRSAMERFQKNIDRILLCGGSVDDSKRWQEYHNIYHTAIRIIRNAYLPNAQRKREYLGIYADIEKQNEILLKYLVRLHSANQTELLLEAQNTVNIDKGGIASAAMQRWKESGKRTSGSGNHGGSESNGEHIDR